MRCTRARLALIERSLGETGPREGAALDRHLARCAPCATEAREQERVVSDLRLLHAEAPVAVDVVGRVMAEVRPVASSDRRDVPQRQLGWASAACTAGGLVLAVAFLMSLPGFVADLRSGIGVAAALAQMAGVLLRPVKTILAIPFALLEAAIEGLAPVVRLLSTLEPAAWGAVGLAYLVMMATIVSVVGRDLLRARSLHPRSGHR